MVDEKDAFFWSHMAAGSLVVYLTASLEDYILTSVFSTLKCAYSLVQSCRVFSTLEHAHSSVPSRGLLIEAKRKNKQ